MASFSENIYYLFLYTKILPSPMLVYTSVRILKYFVHYITKVFIYLLLLLILLNLPIQHMLAETRVPILTQGPRLMNSHNLVAVLSRIHTLLVVHITSTPVPLVT